MIRLILQGNYLFRWYIFDDILFIHCPVCRFIIPLDDEMVIHGVTVSQEWCNLGKERSRGLPIWTTPKRVYSPRLQLIGLLLWHYQKEVRMDEFELARTEGWMTARGQESRIDTLFAYCLGVFALRDKQMSANGNASATRRNLRTFDPLVLEG